MSLSSGPWYIDDVLTFYQTAHDPATGGAVDADAVPSYRVYEVETGTAILTGTMALLDSGNTVGDYSESITLSAANGFEVGKSYQVYREVVVGGVTDTAEDSFKVIATPFSAADVATAVWAAGTRTLTSFGTLVADIWAGVTAAFFASFFTQDSGETFASAVPGSVVQEIADNATGSGGDSAATIADAVWDEAQAAHLVAGSMGETMQNMVIGLNLVTATVLTLSTFDPATQTVTVETIDGTAFADAFAAVMAATTGVADRSGNTITYKRQDGTTTVLTVTVGTPPGTRTASTITP